MRGFLIAILCVLVAATLSAQDKSPARAFDYDKNAPFNIQEKKLEYRGSVAVHDISYSSPKGGRVPAYLVVPEETKRKGRRFAGVIWNSRNCPTCGLSRMY